MSESEAYSQLAGVTSDPAIRHLLQHTLPLATSSGASQELIQSLKEALDLSWQRLKFEDDITTPQSETCAKMGEETRQHDWERVHKEGKMAFHCRPEMMSGNTVGQFLKSFLSAQKSKDVLEIGMFTGFSALAMAEALPADGKVETIDREEYLKTLVTGFVQGSPHASKIHINIGQATEVLQEMISVGKSFDAIFLDANKDQYHTYLKQCLEGDLLRPGGTILVDNAFMHGRGYVHPDSPSFAFAQALKADSSLHVVLVPIRDGVFLVRRRAEVDGGRV